MAEEIGALQGSETVERPPWRPSTYLHSQMLLGIVAMLVTAGLSLASSLMELSAPQPAGWTLAHSLGWSSFISLFVVVRAYWVLAEETSSISLRRSATCLFGSMLLLEIYNLTAMGILSPGGEVLAWTVFVCGFLILGGVPFLPTQKSAPPETAPAPNPENETPQITAGKKAAGTFGGLLAGAAVLLKVLGNGLFAKFLIFRFLGRLLRRGGGSLLAFLAVIVMGCGFLIWFAVAKIRLRDKLGALAMLIGWSEILLFNLFFVIVAWLVIAHLHAIHRAGLNHAQMNHLEDATHFSINLTLLIADCIWSALSILLFWGVRHLYDPSDEWLEDLES